MFFFSPECFSSSSSSIRFLLRSRFLIIIWYGSICIYLYTISFRFMMMTALYANCCVKTISHDLLELLEKLQTSRLDDQRCVLPAYFTTQVNLFLFSGKCFFLFHFIFLFSVFCLLLSLSSWMLTLMLHLQPRHLLFFPRSCLCSCFSHSYRSLSFPLLTCYSNLWERKNRTSAHLGMLISFPTVLLNLVWCVCCLCLCVCAFVIGYVFHFPYCRARRFVSGPHLFLVHFAISFRILTVG